MDGWMDRQTDRQTQTFCFSRSAYEYPKTKREEIIQRPTFRLQWSITD